ncbi:DUF2157 domain-containing protein [Pedobacter sp. PACM 27299]|uniref:DUF2157 domain-containing protein n=1 Tax=Pedobacter sp. PACM 27299 TaxID=1727164 RepID=UPI00078644A6|nr:DUF2157 domain-containing protein [Pedobacter sp. PACM 27299]
MKLDAEKSEFLEEMLEHWQEQKLLSPAQVEKLRSSYETKHFDWRRLAQYSFWIAMACGVISLGALLVDNKVLKYLESLYQTSDGVISLLSAIAAGYLYYLSFKRKKTKSQEVFSNEALVFTAVMLTANAIAYLGKAIHAGGTHFSLLLLIAVFIYGILAYIFQSRLIWAFALISLGAWFGTESGYLSRGNWYFIGMNYPLRFVCFGFVLTASSFLMKGSSAHIKSFSLFRKRTLSGTTPSESTATAENRSLETAVLPEATKVGESLPKKEASAINPSARSLGHFFQITYIIGMMYLFFSLWLLSVFGNFGTLEEWYGVRQLSLFYWAIVSASACVISIFIGLKYRDDIAREFGITFLFINLYTRYFEYFWDSWHKAVFFCVLAASFWIIGRKAEKIWNLEFLKQ